MQVLNKVQWGLLATTLYWVVAYRSSDPQDKTVYFSKKIPVNFATMHNGQHITLLMIISAVLCIAKTQGEVLEEDTWEKTPEQNRWVKG